MKTNRRNVNRKNSTGISKHEFKLGSQAASKVNRDAFNDFDYLDKLSPEEFAWLAEFASADLQSFDVDPEVVGKENADIMNSKDFKKVSYRNKNYKQNNDPYFQRARVSIDIKDEKGHYADTIPSDSYQSMIDEIEDEIDRFWREKIS